MSDTHDWIEELLLEKAQLQQQADLLMRIVAYLDPEKEETPIPLASLKEINVPNITVDEEGVRLNYVTPINS